MGEATNPGNKNVFMGLMQAINRMKYTPFFHLCERNSSYKDNNDNYPQMIQMLIE